MLLYYESSKIVCIFISKIPKCYFGNVYFCPKCQMLLCNYKFSLSKIPSAYLSISLFFCPKLQKRYFVNCIFFSQQNVKVLLCKFICFSFQSTILNCYFENLLQKSFFFSCVKWQSATS